MIPDYGINTIGDITLTEGYHLYADGDDQTLFSTGLLIDPADWTLDLAPNRFNSIAYLHGSSMDSELALESIADVISIVQDDDGNAWIPELGVPMGLMHRVKDTRFSQRWIPWFSLPTHLIRSQFPEWWPTMKSLNHRLLII